MRAGTITITNSSATKGSSSVSLILTNGVNTYKLGAVCDFVHCSPVTDTYAFNLGSNFSIEAIASSAMSQHALDPYESAGAIADMTFSLAEVDGTSVDAILAPEPTTFTLLSAAALVAALCLMKRK